MNFESETHFNFDVERAELYRKKMEDLLAGSADGVVQLKVLDKRKELLQKYGAEEAKSHALFHVLLGKADTIAEQPISHDDFANPEDSVASFIDSL